MMYEIGESGRWHGVCDWLHVAAGIASVKVDAASFDPGFGWCSDADNYAIAQDDLIGSFVHRLATIASAN